MSEPTILPAPSQSEILGRWRKAISLSHDNDGRFRMKRFHKNDGKWKSMMFFNKPEDMLSYTMWLIQMLYEIDPKQLDALDDLLDELD